MPTCKKSWGSAPYHGYGDPLGSHNEYEKMGGGASKKREEVTPPNKLGSRRVTVALCQFNARGDVVASRGAPFQWGPGHGIDTLYRCVNMDGNIGNGNWGWGIHSSCRWIRKP